MIGYMLHRLPAIHRPVDRHAEGEANHLFHFMNAIGRRRAALRGHRLLRLAVAPFYLLAMLLNLIWVCLCMPDLEADADADGLAWESAALGAAQRNAQRADHLLSASKPSTN